MENSNNTRWWETYLVRYITGSVVGAVIVYVILRKLKIFWFPSLKDMQSANLVILASLGFAYCYMASAPITLLHAVRSIILKGKGIVQPPPKKLPGIKAWFSRLMEVIRKFDWLFFFILLWMTVFGALLGWASNPVLWALSAASMTVLTYVYVISFKLYRKLEMNSEWQEWYFLLAKKRSGSSGEKKEFIESYRHLREHGNAFFIVTLEVCLGVVLYQIATLLDSAHTSEEKAMWAAALIAAILYWILSGAICWHLGNKLEQYLIEQPQ